MPEKVVQFYKYCDEDITGFTILTDRGRMFQKYWTQEGPTGWKEVDLPDFAE